MRDAKTVELTPTNTWSEKTSTAGRMPLQMITMFKA